MIGLRSIPGSTAHLLLVLAMCAVCIAQDEVGEPPADLVKVREFRERLARSTVTETRAVLREMESAPHSKYGPLIFEALLRAMERVEGHEQRLGELRGELEELAAQIEQAEEQKSPSQKNRLTERQQELKVELADRRARSMVEQTLVTHLKIAILPLAEAISRPGREALARDLVGRLDEHREVVERSALLSLIGQVDTPRAILALMNELREHRSPPECKVRALKGLGRMRAEAAVPAVVAALGDDDWRVRVEAVEVLRLLHRRSSIPILIELLQTAQGRLKDDVGAALRSLTAQKLFADHATWQRFWSERQADFSMPEAPAALKLDQDPGSGGANFYGISTFSLGVIFVLDVSGSMNQPALEGTRASRKIDIAISNLKNAVLSLNPQARFNVLLYSSAVETAFEEPVIASNENRRAALQFVEARGPGQATNIYDAMTRAFSMARRKGGRQRPSSVEIDTIFFLSDGQATAGMVQRSDLLLEAICGLNQDLCIQIHCVGVGQHDVEFLKALAARSHGQYVAH